MIGKFSCPAGGTRNIELQLRTSIQHYWATAVEIVDLFTGQALKSNQGHPVWKEFFAAVSEQFAIMDRIHLFDSLSEKKQKERFLEELLKAPELHKSNRTLNRIATQISIIKRLNGYANTIQIVDQQQEEVPDADYVLLKIETDAARVTAQFFSKENSKEAEKFYIDAEKEAGDDQGVVVALVSSGAVGGVKEAYPNYFADSSCFLEHLNVAFFAHGKV